MTDRIGNAPGSGISGIGEPSSGPGSPVKSNEMYERPSRIRTPESVVNGASGARSPACTCVDGCRVMAEPAVP